MGTARLDSVEYPSVKKRSNAMSKVISIHHLELKPSTSPEEFERYLAEMPRVDTPGLKAYYTRADRGEGIGKYALIMEFSSAERRDELFPVEGTPEAGDEGKQLMAAFMPFFTKGAPMVVGELREDVYTDYVAVSDR